MQVVFNHTIRQPPAWECTSDAGRKNKARLCTPYILLQLCLFLGCFVRTTTVSDRKWTRDINVHDGIICPLRAAVFSWKTNAFFFVFRLVSSQQGSLASSSVLLLHDSLLSSAILSALEVLARWQFTFLAQEKSRFTWLRPFAIIDTPSRACKQKTLRQLIHNEFFHVLQRSLLFGNLDQF